MDLAVVLFGDIERMELNLRKVGQYNLGKPLLLVVERSL
jgi:hypothetical protein